MTLALQCVYCVEVAGSDSDGASTSSRMRLVADLQTVCYTDAHRGAAVFDYFVIFLYGCGFPILCGVLLYRSFRPAPGTDQGANDIAAARRADHYGYLFRGLVDTAYFFRMFGFIISWGFALQAVFSRSIAVQVFVPGIFFLANVTLVGWLWPYSFAINNLVSIIVGFGGVVQVMIYLGLLGASDKGESASSDDRNGYIFLYWMCALGALSLGLIVYLRVRDRARASKLEAAISRRLSGMAGTAGSR